VLNTQYGIIPLIRTWDGVAVRRLDAHGSRAHDRTSMAQRLTGPGGLWCPPQMGCDASAPTAPSPFTLTSLGYRSRLGVGGVGSEDQPRQRPFPVPATCRGWRSGGDACVRREPSTPEPAGGGSIGLGRERSGARVPDRVGMVKPAPEAPGRRGVSVVPGMASSWGFSESALARWSRRRLGLTVGSGGWGLGLAMGRRSVGRVRVAVADQARWQGRSVGSSVKPGGQGSEVRW
jgi:hypothetical protein